jgi:signal transduction histidine kinase
MAELLLATPMTEVQREYADVIRMSAEAQMAIINDILDFSKLAAGMLELHHEDFDVRTTVNEVRAVLAAQAAAKNLSLTACVDPDTPESVRSDPNRVRQVLSNLANNAVKFTTQGHIVIRAAATDPTSEHPLLRFEVSDTGIGIESGVQDRIFDAYTQADASTTRAYGGTGLGLSIARELVHLLGGEIRLTSAPGIGSTFTFTVPCAHSRERSGDGRPRTPAPPTTVR